MRILKAISPSCSANQNCSQRARTYFNFSKKNASLSLGIASVISWGVAEVPQIITNYREKSTDGLSIAFLLTWIVGDIFNVTGCLLEPATLQTQFYMALLYTATTGILTAQTVYYGHIYPRIKENRTSLLEKLSSNLQQEENEKLIGPSPATASISIHVTTPVTPVDYTSGSDSYYMSARSLSKSPLHTTELWIEDSQDSGSTTHSDPRNWNSKICSREALLGGFSPTKSAIPSNIKNTLSVVIQITLAVFLLGVYTLYLSRINSLPASPPGTVIVVGRKLLQDKGMEFVVQEGSQNSGIGSFLGWAMAVIYLGGRVPQIWLNIRRGNVKGLNPLMFIFALIGNTTYLASILVSSLEWSKIEPNMPWLVDAGGCALLDAFIIIQFAYFRYWKPKVSRPIEHHLLA